MYREAFRVLKPGGRLVLSHINAGPNGPVEFFPVGWASVPENSFLATHEETRRDLAAAGFEILTFRDLAVAPARPPRRGASWRQRARRPSARMSFARRWPADADQQHACPRRRPGMRGADRGQKARLIEARQSNRVGHGVSPSRFEFGASRASLAHAPIRNCAKRYFAFFVQRRTHSGETLCPADRLAHHSGPRRTVTATYLAGL